MSDGLRIDIESNSSELDRAIKKVRQLETALNRVSVGKLTKELDSISKHSTDVEARTGKSVDDITKTLQKLEAQAKSTAGQYAASFGHLGPEIRKTVDATRSLSNAVKDLEKVMQTSHKTSAGYRSALEAEIKILDTKSARLTANSEAAKRTIETNNRLRAQINDLNTIEGKKTALLKEQLSAKESLYKASAQAFTIEERQKTTAQQLANRTAELNTELGKKNLITKESIKGQERAITLEVRQANALTELQQRLAYLNSDLGKETSLLKESIKYKEQSLTADVRRKNALENLTNELKHAKSEEGKKAAVLKENIKYQNQTATVEVRRTNTLNSLRSELEYVQSAEGRKAARIRENIKYEQEMVAAETKRLNTLARLRADLTAMQSQTGRNIALAQQEIKTQRELNAAQAKRAATIATLKDANSSAAQVQQREIELLRRKNELTQRELQVDARKATLAQEQSVRLRELNAQIAAVQTSTGRMLAAKERELQIVRRLQAENRLYSQSLVGIQVRLEKLRIAKEAANQATAGFRAGIMGAGASFGIFTSSTILFASAVYSVVAAFRQSIASGVEFEAVMDRVNAVMDRTGKSSAALEARTRSLAEQTVFTANEVGQGMLYLGMAGMATNDALASIESSLRLASIGMLDMGTTADIVTNILFGFGLQASELELLVDRMAHAITDSNMNVQQLGNAMSYVAPLARQADISIEELVASLQVLHNTGIKASRAGTAMRTTILSLMAPTERAKGILREYNIAVDDHTGRMRNWTELLKELAGAQLSLGEVENLVDKRQAVAFKAMIDSASATRKWKNELQEADPALANINTQLDYYIDRLQRSKGTAEEMQLTMEDNLRGDWMKLLSAVKEKYLDFFNAHKEGYRNMVQNVTDFIKSLDVDAIDKWFNRIIEWGTKAIQIFAGLKAASVGLSLGTQVGHGVGALVGGAVGSVVGPLGTAGGAALGSTIGSAVGGLGASTAAGLYVYDKAGDIRDEVIGIFQEGEDAIDFGVRNTMRRYEDYSAQHLRLVREQSSVALSEAKRLLDEVEVGLERAIDSGVQGAIDSFETQKNSLLASIEDLGNKLKGIDNNLAAKGQLIGSIEDVNAAIAAQESKLQGMAASYATLHSLPPGTVNETQLSAVLEAMEAENAALVEMKRQRDEIYMSEVRSQELKNEQATTDRNRALEAIVNGEAEIAMREGRISVEEQYNSALATRRQLEAELESQMITLEDGTETPRSASVAKDIMERRIENTNEIVRLERQLSQEQERQAQAAQRFTERQGKALARAEQELNSSRAQLKEAWSFNDAVEHRNKMFEKGYLLLDDQDYQLVRQIELQEDSIRLLESELAVRMASRDHTDEELAILRENITVQQLIKNALEEQRQSKLDNVNLESQAYKMAVLHKNALEQMYSTIESSTIALLESGFKDTSTFFDSIVAQFKRMLAELAYQAAIKPIIVNVVSSMGSAFFGPQAAQAFAAGQGVTLGGTGGSAMSLGQMGSSAWNFLKNGGQSAAMGNLGAGIAASKFGQTLGLSTAVDMSAGPVAGSVAGFGGQFSQLTGAGEFLKTGMSYSPWGTVGAIGANMLGLQGSGNMIIDTVMQTGGSIAGGALGAKLGAAGGPIGAVVGAIAGTALAGLFGGKPSNKTGNAEIDLASGVTESWGMSGDKFSQENVDSATQLAQLISGNIVGAISGITGNAITGTVKTGVGGRDPFAFTYTDSEGNVTSTSEGAAGTSKFNQFTLTKDSDTYFNAVTEFFATVAGLDLELYKSLAAESELLIDSIKRVETQFVLVSEAFKLVGNTAEVTKEFADSWSKEFVTPLLNSGESLAEGVARVGAEFAIVSRYIDMFNLKLGETAQQVIATSSELVKAAGGNENLSAISDAYYENFYSDAEKFDYFAKQLEDSFGTLGVKLPSTIAGFRALVEHQDLTTQSGRETYVALLQLSPQVRQFIDGIGQIGDALTATNQQILNALTAQVEAAYKGVNDAINARKQALDGEFASNTQSHRDAIQSLNARLSGLNNNDQINLLQGLVSSLSSAFDALKLSDEDSVRSRRTESQAWMMDALTSARSGNFPDADEMGTHLSALQEPSEALFGSFEDYARDFLLTKRLIGDLRDETQNALSIEEQMLDAARRSIENQIWQHEQTIAQLEEQYKLEVAALEQEKADAEALYNAAMGIDTSVQSVTEAMLALAAAIGDLESFQEKLKEETTTDPVDLITQAYKEVLGRDPDQAGFEYWKAQVDAGLVKPGDLNSALAQGAINDDVTAASSYLKSKGISYFSEGGFHTGGWRIVGENGPELEYTRPSKIYSNTQSKGLLNVDPMVAELRQLTAEVKQLKAELKTANLKIAENTQRTAKVLEGWEYEGQPETRDY